MWLQSHGETPHKPESTSALMTATPLSASLCLGGGPMLKAPLRGALRGTTGTAAITGFKVSFE